MDKAPADCGVVNLGGTVADGAGGGDDGIQTAGAEAVDGQGGDGFGQARQQHRHAGDVAVILARLIGAAENHLVYGQIVQVQQAVDHAGGQIVGAHGGKAARVAADGGTAGGAEVDFGHRASKAGAGR